jgi:hypothetical protein
MQRMGENVSHAALLYLPAGIHHDDALGGLGHHPQIMGDQHDRGSDPAFKVAHQVKDLRLDRHVERSRRLVGDQQFGVAGQRHGDHHALPHAAGELVGIFPHPARRRGDSDQGEHLNGAGFGVLCRETFVKPQRLADLAANGQHRVEAGHGLLEDHADVLAADVAHLGIGQGQQIAALKADLSRDLSRGLRHETQDRHRRDGFAASALAHDGDGLSGIDVEGQALHGAHDPIERAEMRLQTIDLEQRHAG